VRAEDLQSALAKGQYGLLSGVDFPAMNPEECLGISAEAPYYLSHVFDALGKQAQALRMLELAWSRGPGTWKEEAGALLAERYVAEKSFDKAIETARRLLASPLAPALAERCRRALVEALYWAKEDAAVLSEAARLENPDAEVLLFRAVSSLRLSLPSAHDLIMRLIISEKVSSLHGRVYTFLVSEPGFLGLFSQAEQRLFQAKSALQQGDWTKGLPLMEQVLAAADLASLADGALVVDLGNAYGYAGKQSAGARFMEKLSSRLSGQARADALEQAGKLYRKAKEYPKSLALLRVAAAEAPTAQQRDRARWFVLDVLIAQNAPDLVGEIETVATSWSDPVYFSDLLEDEIASLVTSKSWKTLMGLWRVLGSTGPQDIRAQLSYIIARAWQEGAIPRLPGTPPVTARELFRDAVRRSPSGYYGILAASMLGELPDRAVPGAAGEDPGGTVSLDPLVMGFLPFGLTRLAYNRLWAARDALSDAQLLEAGRRLSAAGDTRSSLYIVGAVARRRRLSAVELALYYPKAYGSLIEPLAAGAGIPVHVLYGQVREESYFDAAAVSSAGALGLSQLMPSTAAAVARGLRMVEPDLRDPTTNLTIGVRHLADLLKNVDSMTKALLSYNAGLTRLRQWEKAANGLPVDLFVESVPIAETRDYIRKILVSSVMYAFLYHDADPREAALSFFGIGKKALEPAQSRGAFGAATPR
jgi:hypothetical protein